MLETRLLRFRYDEVNTFEFPDIRLSDQKEMLILGESGIGKTTFLHLLAGLLEPLSGQVIIKGHDLNKFSVRKRDKFRGKHIGLIFQKPHFVQSLTLQQNLSLVQYLAGKSQNKSKISSVLKALGIAHKVNIKPYQLSQGEQQRATIAMATINEPEIILADEPTASLDDKNCGKAIHLLKQQAVFTGARLVIITHDQRLLPHFKNTIHL
jgi:ABC-type lipoprotein export system ATPase subunit